MINKLFNYLNENEIKEIKKRINENNIERNVPNIFNELIDILNKMNKYYYDFNDTISFNFKDTINELINSYFNLIIQYNYCNRIDKENMLYFYNSLFNKPENYNICETLFKQLNEYFYCYTISTLKREENYESFTHVLNLILFEDNPFNFFIYKYNKHYIFKNDKLNNNFIELIISSYIYYFSNIFHFDIHSKEKISINNEKDLIYDFVEFLLKDIKTKEKFNKNDRYFVKTIVNSFINLFKTQEVYKDSVKHIKSIIFDYFNNNKFNDKTLDNFIYKKLITEF